MFCNHHFISYADLNEMTLVTCYNSYSVDLYENKLCIQKMQHCDKNISCDVKGTTTIVILTKIKEPHIRRQ